MTDAPPRTPLTPDQRILARMRERESRSYAQRRRREQEWVRLNLHRYLRELTRKPRRIFGRPARRKSAASFAGSPMD